ncbi:MAG: MarR family transcriptional regulator [Oscillospiraceae bacterium]|nr:MarR family transcriptional regulator [Oscillospiraceae bacterium]
MNKYLKANAVLSMFSKNYMELKRGLPIRPSEMGVLNIITETPGPHTSVMLAELLGVSKPMITAHLSSLSGKGYITKEQSPEDKRVYYVLPTGKARALVQEAKTDLNKKLDCLVQEMGQEAFDTLVALAQEANTILQRDGRSGEDGSE